MSGMVREFWMEERALGVFSELVRSNERCRMMYDQDRSAYYNSARRLQDEYVDRFEPELAPYRSRARAIDEQMTLRENILVSALRGSRKQKSGDA